MPDAFICDYIRTPIGRYAGALAQVRTDDLAAIPLAALLARNPGMNPAAVEEVWMGCANQAGEDNRNVARMALLLAGLPETVPGATVNRLCGSGMEAVSAAARAIKAGEIGLAIDAKGDHRLCPDSGNCRQHHRLALCEPQDEGDLRHRLDA